MNKKIKNTLAIFSSALIFSACKFKKIDIEAKFPVSTFVTGESESYLVSKNQSWRIKDESSPLEIIFFMPKIPKLNEKIMRVAEIIEKEGYTQQFTNKKEEYIKQLDFEEGGLYYRFELTNYNENLSNKMDSLHFSIYNKILSLTFIKYDFLDIGLKGLDMAAEFPERRFEISKYQSIYEKYLDIFLLKHENPE
ncbi:MAG: hypothetical protein ACOYT4_03000 [Nanoarchaeota archaeon]